MRSWGDIARGPGIAIYRIALPTATDARTLYHDTSEITPQTTRIPLPGAAAGLGSKYVQCSRHVHVPDAVKPNRGTATSHEEEERREARDESRASRRRMLNGPSRARNPPASTEALEVM